MYDEQNRNALSWALLEGQHGLAGALLCAGAHASPADTKVRLPPAQVCSVPELPVQTLVYDHLKDDAKLSALHEAVEAAHGTFCARLGPATAGNIDITVSALSVRSAL